MKKLFLLFFAIVIFASCKKDNSNIPQSNNSASKSSKLKSGTRALGANGYIDTVYITVTQIYRDGTSQYPGILVDHTHKSSKILVTYTPYTSPGHNLPETPVTSFWDIPTTIYLTPTNDNGTYFFTLETLTMNLSSQGERLTNYSKSYTLKLTKVQDENGNDITSQVYLGFPEVATVYYQGLKDPTGGPHPIQPGGPGE